MVSQCANPDRRRELRYLRDGKIYQFVLSSKTGSKRLEHFWLCGECSKTMILIRVDHWSQPSLPMWVSSCQSKLLEL
jgi:hypothetical protein